MHFQKQHTEQDEQDPEDIHTHYDIVECIAEGSFGKVYSCISRLTQEQCAVKLVDKTAVRKSKIDSLRNEAHLLQQTNHTNIVKLRGFKETKRFIFLEMQLIRCGTVGNLIRRRLAEHNPLTNEEISQLMKGIFSGLAYLHSLNIVHRDLKTGRPYCVLQSENVLISDAADLSKVKIADLGLSVKVDVNSSKPYDHCGTLLFMAPEVLRKHPYNKPIDVWSCAVILFMLYNGGAHPLGIKSKISSEDYLALMRHRWPKLHDQLAQSFIQKLAQYDPVNRYTAIEASRHPFITRNHDDFIPLTCNQSFTSFMVCHRTSTLIRASFLLGELFERVERMTVEQGYLEKVDEQNQLAKRLRQRHVESRRGSKNKVAQLSDTNQEISGLQIRQSSASMGDEQQSKQSLSPMHNRMLKLINLSFVSQTEDCIKIRDFAQEDKATPCSAKLPSSKYKQAAHPDSKRVTDFMTTGSFSPVKSSQGKKKSIINFPKLPEVKASILQVKKANSIQKEYEIQKSSRSPTRRPDSSRKYVRTSVPDQNPFKAVKP